MNTRGLIWTPASWLVAACLAACLDAMAGTPEVQEPAASIDRLLAKVALALPDQSVSANALMDLCCTEDWLADGYGFNERLTRRTFAEAWPEEQKEFGAPCVLTADPGSLTVGKEMAAVYVTGVCRPGASGREGLNVRVLWVLRKVHGSWKIAREMAIPFDRK